MAKRTLDELVDAVVLKDYEDKEDIQDEVLAWLNDAYIRCARRDLNCFQTEATITLNSGTQKYLIENILPNYRKIINPIFSTLGNIKLQDPKRVPQKLYTDYVEDYSTSFATSYPTIAWVYGPNLYFYPIPDLVYKVTIWYYQTHL